MKKTEENRQNAFTLIEILVVLGIFSLVMTALLQFLTGFLNMKFSTEARQRIRNEGNSAADQIDFLVRNSVTIPNVCRDNTTQTITDQCYLGSSDCHQLIVNVNETTGTQTTVIKKLLKAEEGMIKLCTNPSTANEKCVALTASKEQTKNAQITIGGTAATAITPNPDDLQFSCRNDEFTNGLIVTVKFPMVVKRKTMQATDTKIITESFVKDIAVRNRFDYQ